MAFAPESKAARRHRLLDARYDRWYAQPQPVRFYLWLFWLHLVPLYWLYFRITTWLWRRKIKVRGFTSFTLPIIRGSTSLMPPLSEILSVQPMTAPVAQTFYFNYRMGPSAPEPRTRKASGWLWGIIVWEKI